MLCSFLPYSKVTHGSVIHICMYILFFPFSFSFSFFFFCNMACVILVSQPGIKPVPPAVEVKEAYSEWCCRICGP